jgi:RNA polymerase sigma-70 factor (ECF subfamily)
LSINNLYIEACRGGKEEENRLFKALTVRFRLFTIQRIRNEQDAEEIVQIALAVIYQEYEALDIRTSFAAWAYRVLERRILNFLNKKKKLAEREVQFQEEYIPLDLPTDIEINNIKGRLLECLRKICRTNSRYARILNMHYQGYKTEEICKKMNITSENCYTILSRARSLLEYCLDNREIS